MRRTKFSRGREIRSRRGWERLAASPARAKTDLPFFRRNRSGDRERKDRKLIPFQGNYTGTPYPNEIWVKKATWEIAVKSCALLPVACLGIVGNVVLLAVTVRNKCPKTPTSLLAANMAVTDTATLLVNSWMFLVRDAFQNYVLGEFACNIEAFCECEWKRRESREISPAIVPITSVPGKCLCSSFFSADGSLQPDRHQLQPTAGYSAASRSAPDREIGQILRGGHVDFGFRFRFAARHLPNVQGEVAVRVREFRRRETTRSPGRAAFNCFSFKVRQWQNFLEIYCEEDKEVLPLYWNVIISLIIWIPLGIMFGCYSVIFYKLDKYEKKVLKRVNPMSVNYKKRVAKTFFVIVTVFIICRVPFTALVFWRSKLLQEKKPFTVGRTESRHRKSLPPSTPSVPRRGSAVGRDRERANVNSLPAQPFAFSRANQIDILTTADCSLDRGPHGRISHSLRARRHLRTKTTPNAVNSTRAPLTASAMSGAGERPPSSRTTGCNALKERSRPQTS